MFTVTDEVRQIEQPMERLIEKTNHKCKKCTRYNKKQHHCEPPIKNKKYPYISKTINRTNNLEKHLRSCEKAPTHPAKQQLRQMALDGPTSSRNGPSTPKKLIVEKVQVGGATLESTWNSRVRLKIHRSQLQEGFQHQQQKRRPATIERDYP